MNDSSAVKVSDNQMGMILAMLIVGVAGGTFPVIMPLMLNSMIEAFGLSSSQGSLVISSEMAGAGVGIILVSLVVPKANWHRLLFIYAGISLVANLAASFSSEFMQFAVSRFFAGIGQGALMGLASAALGSTRNPDRNFGIFMAAIFSFGALALYLISTLSPVFGPTFGYMMMSALAIIGIICVVKFPANGKAAKGASEESADQVAESADAAPAQQGKLLFIVMGLAGILLLYTGLASIWPFMGVIGLQIGVEQESVDGVLALSQVFAVAGGLGATFLADRLGKIIPIIVGALGVMLSVGYIYMSQDKTSFYLGAYLFMFFWIFVVPYLMGVMAALDPTGRAVVLNTAMQYGGFTLGPIIVGMLVVNNNYFPGLTLGIACCALSLLVFLPAAMQVKSPKAA